MIEMDESEFLDCDFTDDSLRAIAALCGGPYVATMLLLPGPVPVIWGRAASADVV